MVQLLKIIVTSALLCVHAYKYVYMCAYVCIVCVCLFGVCMSTYERAFCFMNKSIARLIVHRYILIWKLCYVSLCAFSLQKT